MSLGELAGENWAFLHFLITILKRRKIYKLGGFCNILTMAAHPKLTSEQEREVALAYLCGVDTKKIKEKYGVSDATTRGNISGKRSREWDDPLVEFYRETNPHNRDRNAVHLYLAFSDVPDVLHGELVDKQKDQPVRDIVEESLYRPGIDQIVKWTALDHYISPTASLSWAPIKKEGLKLERGNPYEALLKAIVGQRDEEQIVRAALTERLSKEYDHGGPSSLQAVFPKVAYDIIQKVKEGGLGITPAKKKAIKEVLQTLPDRDRQVIGMRFGLDGYDGPKHLEQIGIDMEVTRERVRQIEAKAIRRLQHPARARRLAYIAGLVTEQDVQTYLADVQHQAQYQAERRKWKKEVRPEIEQEVLSRLAADPSLKKRLAQTSSTFRDEILDHPVDELELSVRTVNGLRNTGVKTIGELAGWTEQRLLKTKNFGRKSLRELKETLAEYGLNLARV